MHRVLKIQLMDESRKAVLIDSSKPIRENIISIGEKVMVKDMDEYALRRVTSGEGDWLDPDKTLYEEDVQDDEVLLFAKRFFSNDFNVDMNDPMQLHLIYVQASNAVVTGKYVASYLSLPLFLRLSSPYYVHLNLLHISL